jgi:hypothetical protein
MGISTIVVVVDRDQVQCCALTHNSTFVMSNILELNCWVLGDATRRVFPVKIASSETVGYLKKVIKDEKKPVFDDITADSLDLWKVSDH